MDDVTVNGETYEAPALRPLGTPWYCVHCKPGKEQFALMHLERQNFECFLPMLKAKIVYRGKKQWVTAPMFRRYLFVRAVPHQDFSKIRSTQGVSRLVAFNGVPAFVPDEMISEIREHCENDVYIQPEDRPQVGDEVTIVDGPYAGIEAIFMRETSAEERVIILMEMMQDMVKVEIARDSIVKKQD